MDLTVHKSDYLKPLKFWLCWFGSIFSANMYTTLGIHISFVTNREKFSDILI